MAEPTAKAGRNDNGVHPFLPSTLVAATLPLVKGSVGHRVAYHAACLALQTERICMIIQEDGDRVHYLAGDAREFAEFAVPVSTSLISALPGFGTHQGDGVYFHPIGEMLACLIVRDRRIKAYVGTKQAARRFPSVEKAEELPVHELWLDDPLVQGCPVWSGYAEQERDTNRKLMHKLIAIGFGVNVVMGSVWGGSVVWEGYSQAKMIDSQTKMRQSLSMAVGQLQAAPYKHPAWTELQEVSRFVVEKKGRLDEFQFAKGKMMWRLTVPNSVTGEEITRALGKVETNPDNIGIRISKGQ